MAISQKRSNRKVSGGRYKPVTKKRKHKGSLPTFTKLAPLKKKQTRTRAGYFKTRLLSADHINVFNPKTKKTEKVKIETVTDNSANKNYIRRNIITKGALVKTSLGKVRITSRPGQYSSLEGVLVK